MRKRRAFWLLTIAAAILICSCFTVQADDSFFVAVNDSLPLMLTSDPAPYLWNDALYVPYTVFEARPGGIVSAYDPDRSMLTLFTRSQRMSFHLDGDYYQNENEAECPVTLVFLHGVPLLPVNEIAAHFGLSVSLLESQSGYTIVRFTDGYEIYDDALFVERAEKLIQYRIQEEQMPDSGEEWENSSYDTPSNGYAQSRAVYLAITGEGVSSETLDLLQDYGGHAAFFLTAEQMNDQKLVRRILAEEHAIGVTAEAGTENWQEALDQANDRLRLASSGKTLLALVPQDEAATLTSYCTFFVSRKDDPKSEEAHGETIYTDNVNAYLCSEYPEAFLNSISDETVHLLRLRENTKWNP